METPLPLSDPSSLITSECSSGDELSRPATRNAESSARRIASRPSQGHQVPIAVVGMACRLPGHSNSPTALWDFLQHGGVAANEPPASRFSLSGHFDEHRRPRTMKSPGGMFMEDVDPQVFDGQFFNISRTDCIAMDPQQRQLLEVTYECLENAGVPLERLGGKKVGVLVGTNIVDYGAVQNRDPEDRPESATIGVASSILSNRISHFLNVNGPSMTIDTACSASLVAVDVASRYLDSFQAEGMLVAGANIWLSPEHNQETGMMRMTQSASGKCHSFDAKADGYVKAEGINVVYLKRLDDALRDGDPIRAIIRGTSANSSGRTAGLANPSPDAQAAAIRAAYANAGIDDFSGTAFLECHGTGTLAGDPIEVKGAASVFAATRPAGQDLVIGSIKSNIGHSEAAAGISGLIKTVLAVENGVIPGNPTFVDPNPNIDWAGSRIRATRTSIKWPSAGSVRRASVNSFGFGGANAHAVVENAPQRYCRHVSSYKKITSGFFDDDDEDQDGSGAAGQPTLLAFSANDQPSLKKYVESLSAHLTNPSVSVDLADLAYTLSEKRTRHYYRAFSLGHTSKVIDESSLVFGKKASSPPRVGFVFTGQGAQWSKMGLDLVRAFPQAKKVVQDLDAVLQSLPNPPQWSLLSELTEERAPEALRQPEFSQPIVTALQLALVAVTRSWGIEPVAVVGHSSGEIAAAATAGLISAEEAIKAAYYRGQAAKQSPPAERVGMLAVGVGADVVGPYLVPEEGKVQIACYNSPSSLTMSGTTAALEKLRDRLQQDGHFARMLLVDLAYHSDYMAEIGELYESMLGENVKFAGASAGKKPTKTSVRMFSSVTGKMMEEEDTPGVAYWKSNMVSPVRFSQAASELLRDARGADFLVEIGPSNALSGPVSQICKSLSLSTPYTSALKRGAQSTLALYNTAGQLFLADAPVDLAKVNRVHSGTKAPSVIIDLPNYSWNHSAKYWHETQASRDWRFKKFINHDLLGSKMNGTPWQSPVFKKVLKLADLPWLRDHLIGSQVVFPGAGYVAMAVEAMYQTAMVTMWDGEEPAQYRFRLRDVRFSRALVLEEDAATRYTLALTPAHAVAASTRDWFSFRVCSLKDEEAGTYTEHSAGYVCVETDYDEKAKRASAADIEPLKLATPARAWYKSMADSGYNYGPSFRKHLMVEVTMGQRRSRSTVSVEPPPSSYGQSEYPMHPACIDAAFHTGAPAAWKGDLPGAGSVLVPQVISSLVIPARRRQQPEVVDTEEEEQQQPVLPPPTEAIALASAHFLGIGNRENPRNYGTSCTLYDPRDGALLFEMKNLTTGAIEASEDEGPRHAFTRLAWDADVSLLLPGGTATPVLQRLISESAGADAKAQRVLDLVAHKNPTLRVLEWNLGAEDASSLWMPDSLPAGADVIRAACSQYRFSVADASTLVSVQGRLAPRAPATAQFALLDLSRPDADVPADAQFDIGIVKVGSSDAPTLQKAAEAIRRHVKQGGFVLGVGPGFDLSVADMAAVGDDVYLGQNGALAQPTNSVAVTTARPTVNIVSLLGQTPDVSAKVLTEVEKAATGFSFEKCSNPLEISTGQAVLVVDELSEPVMDRVTAQQWDVLKHLVRQQCDVLWVTSGAQGPEVTDPTAATVNGFFRSVRAEEGARLFTLDVETPEGPNTAATIASLLQVLSESTDDKKADAPLDSEFVERGGVVQISRLVPDATLNAVQGPDDGEDPAAAIQAEEVDLHAHGQTVQLGARRLGNVDSLAWAETEAEASPLPDGWLEVEVFAAGLNYKDVVVTMGIVPGDERMLGGEAAGVVTRVTPGVSDFAIGDRVVVFGRGAFSNRVRTTPGRVHRLPDSMSFEEAATLCAVYLTCIYSLFDLAPLAAGQRVLIHSAAGGVGIAAIQLAQYCGAEIFATVGTPEKREFLKTTFGLTDDHIFNSRNTDFADQIMTATGGVGVDVVLNSLTGDMLDASFRVLADGGNMIEIGKKDILGRNSLPMEPFDRNISFRAVDMSHERAPDHLVSRLMSKLFSLINGGHVQPIRPIHVFSYTDVPSAIRFLRAGKHIGKIVLSDGPDAKIKVPILRAPRTLRFRDDGCYLIVGGLKGLCGSLAVYLAKSGCRNLAVVSRGGHADDRSQGLVKQIKALGAHIDLLTADVTVQADVERAFGQTSKPVAGIIQGAMVLRDRPFDSMTVDEYHGAAACKIQGTWNLHQAAEKLGLRLDFFTMLSSISGVGGTRGQANYSAANVFLDSFAAYRRARGLAAASVDLGVVEDAGYLADNEGFQEKHFDLRVFKGINDRLLRKILYVSTLQQQQEQEQQGQGESGDNNGQIVTGIMIPQPADSHLRRDARFSALFRPSSASNSSGPSGSGASADVQALLLLLRSTPAASDDKQVLAATVEVVNKTFTRMLRLSEPMDPARPLSVYGIDSLAAVEVRNWVRAELGAKVTTLDIMNAPSLTGFCEKIVAKVVAPAAS